MNSTTIKLFGLIQIVFAILIFIVLGDTSPMDFLDETKYVVGIYDDSEEGGNSTIKKLERNTFEVSVGKAYDHGFAGVYFQNSDKSFFSTDQKEVLNIDLSADVEAEVYLGFEKYAAGESSRPFRCIQPIKVGPGSTSSKIQLSNFVTPQWWLSANPNASKDIALKDGIISFNVEVTGLPNNEEKVVLGIEGVILSKNENQFKDLIAGALFFIGVILVAYSTKLTKPGKKAPNDENATNHENPIIYYINSNYSSRSLTVNSTSEHFKLSVDYINDRVKKETDLTFKDYVNQLRIEKAKTLLKETDEKAFEISRLCGFNSSASFSQTFKALVGITPNDFRKRK